MGDIRPSPASPSQQSPSRDPLSEPGERRRWAKALGLVLSVHAVPILIAAWWLGPPVVTRPAEPAVLIDMAPPAAPPEPPSAQPPGPREIAQPKPPEPPTNRPRQIANPLPAPRIIETPVSNPAVAIAARPPEPERPPERQATAPSARPAPPAPRAASGEQTWQGLVLGRLNQFKRYPGYAQSRRQQGVPYIRFVMDREGKVLSSRLERGSGFAMLDNEAVALPKRAQPFPKPPDDVPGRTIELVVPVEFYIRMGP